MFWETVSTAWSTGAKLSLNIPTATEELYCSYIKNSSDK